MAEGLQRPLASLFGRRGHESAARYAISMEAGVQVVLRLCALTCPQIEVLRLGPVTVYRPRGSHVLRSACVLQDKD